MAKFCANCGSPLGETDRVCGNCGTPVAGFAPQAATPQAPAAQAAPTQTATKKTGDNKVIGLVAILIVAIVAVVIVANIIGSATGYKATIKKMTKALRAYDMETLDDLASSASNEIYEDWYGEDYEEQYDNMVSGTLDRFEDTVGTIKKISFKINDVSELSKRRIDSTKEDLEEYYDIDVDDIKKIMKVDLTLTVKGTKKSDTYEVNDLYLFKEGDGWKIHYGNMNF